MDVTFRQSQSHNRIDLDLPPQWTPELARLIGYIVAEGYVEQRPDNTGYVSITNNDREVLDDAKSVLETLTSTLRNGVHTRGRPPANCCVRRRVRELPRISATKRCSSPRRRDAFRKISCEPATTLSPDLFEAISRERDTFRHHRERLLLLR
ncbi:hypothetical protein C9J85_14025 [Haloferax sp. wsp5]|nr:hypothetical protein C9J85_14025 [Haloferax sp. wsp5]